MNTEYFAEANINCLYKLKSKIMGLQAHFFETSIFPYSLLSVLVNCVVIISHD